jgi:hypothetical protein
LDLVGKQVGISWLPHQNALHFLPSLVSFIWCILFSCTGQRDYASYCWMLFTRKDI